MTTLLSRTIAALGDEVLDVYWLAGLERNERHDWFVRVVLRGQKSHRFHMKLMPIGLLPILNLSVWFDHGEYKDAGTRGEIGTAIISDVAQCEVITSAEIPSELYEFPGYKAGVQRIFRYRTAEGDILIPVIELVRYLFLHNRMLAHALMRPGALNLLFRPEVPGGRQIALVRFTSEMPARCLSHRFAREFAWLALDSEARRAWDSVSVRSVGQDYVMFLPPSIRNSMWRFRGIRYENQWLVLQLLALSGRRVPCNELLYSHPAFKRVIKVGENDDQSGIKKPGEGDTGSSTSYDYEFDDGEDGSKSNWGLRSMRPSSKEMDFENQVNVRRQVKEVKRTTDVSEESGAATSTTSSHRKKKTIVVTVGEPASTSQAPPLDFKLLTPASPETIGNLRALEEAVRHMLAMLPHVEFFISLVMLKAGRAFSTTTKGSRPAMVVVIRTPDKPPIVLLDVERSGIAALSVMVLRFKDIALRTDELENAIKQLLDGLVDRGGHWNNEVETNLSNVCQCERLPKVLVPRDKVDDYAKRWAQKLVVKLNMLAK